MFVKKWPLEYQKVIKTYLPTFLWDSSDSSDSGDSSDGSDSQRQQLTAAPAEQGRKGVGVTYHSWQLSDLKKSC